MIYTLSINPVARALVLLLVFAAFATVVYGVVGLIQDRSQLRRRLSGEAVMPPTESGQDAPSQLRSHDAQGAWIKLVNRIEQAGLSLGDTKDDVLRKKLAAAGYVKPVAPRVYTLVRLSLVVLLPLIGLLVITAGGKDPSLVKMYVVGVWMALCGLYGPALFVRIKADRRQEQLIHAFPDALDLMLVCVEAGLGLESAFNRVGMEMTRSHPLLSEQMGEMVLELRAGRGMEDALRRLADRAGVDEIRAFCTLLIQSTRLGSSVGATLRTYASEMREKRRMRAEEKAHRLPVLLSVPLVACMLPVMIGVLMLPAVIRVIRTMAPALNHHG